MLLKCIGTVVHTQFGVSLGLGIQLRAQKERLVSEARWILVLRKETCSFCSIYLHALETWQYRKSYKLLSHL